MSRARLVVTGSRNWTDADVLRALLDNLSQALHDDGFTELVVAHGACYPRVDPATGRRPAKSADWLAHLWIHVLPHPLPVIEEAHPADWDAPCRRTCKTGHRRPNRRGPGTYCPTAGNYRNQDKLVTPGANAAAVFLLDDSSGTTDCMRRLIAADIPFTPIVRRSVSAAPVGSLPSPESE